MKRTAIPGTTILALLFCPACIVQTESLKPDTGDVDPQALATLQADLQGVQKQLATLEAALSAQESANKQLQDKVAALQGPTYCPRLVDRAGNVREYSVDMSTPGIIRCTFGADEMVRVGPLWIDRYEASLVDESFYTDGGTSPPTAGTCDGAGTVFGATAGLNGVDDYPEAFPDNGHWSVPIFACSIAGQIPSQWMTWFQAQQACTVAGKRICRNDEWQAAVAGTPDPGPSPGTDGKCVTDASVARATGGGTLCRSSYGTEDMVGNLQEWVAEWLGTPAFDEVSGVIPDFWGPDYGNDIIFNVAGIANDTNAGGYHKRPTAWLRGGNSKSASGGDAAGAFAMSLHNAPSCSFLRVGVRCCAGPG